MAKEKDPVAIVTPDLLVFKDTCRSYRVYPPHAHWVKEVSELKASAWSEIILAGFCWKLDEYAEIAAFRDAWLNQDMH